MYLARLQCVKLLYGHQLTHSLIDNVPTKTVKLEACLYLVEKRDRKVLLNIRSPHPHLPSLNSTIKQVTWIQPSVLTDTAECSYFSRSNCLSGLRNPVLA